MSRIRKERTMPSGTEEHQLWHKARVQLRTLDRSRTSSMTLAEELDALARPLVLNSSEPTDSATVPRLLELYSQLKSRASEEISAIDMALENLGILNALRSADDAPPVVESSSSSRSGLTSGGRKKRRLGDRVTSLSPAPSASPAPSGRPSSPGAGGATNDGPAAPKRGAASSGNAKTESASSTKPGFRRNASSSVTSGSQAAATSSSSTSKEALSLAAGALSASSGYMDSAKARREVLAHQLPLQKGRKVAFRQPNKSKSSGAAANAAAAAATRAANAAAARAADGERGGSERSSGREGSSNSDKDGAAAAAARAAAVTAGLQNVPGQYEEGETWIMATIVECINNDRNRYVVQDAEDSNAPEYNTTLKAIVPLPESLQTLPSEDYRPGQHVMGLYPDTSCFYQAIVIGGGPGLTGISSRNLGKLSKRANEFLNAPYQLEFEDDGGDVKNIPACYVVERP